MAAVIPRTFSHGGFSSEDAPPEEVLQKSLRGTIYSESTPCHRDYPDVRFYTASDGSEWVVKKAASRHEVVKTLDEATRGRAPRVAWGNSLSSPPIIVMEKYDCDLSVYLSGDHPFGERLLYTIQLTHLVAMHSMEGVHGDIKPGNVVLSLKTKQVRLIDFARYSIGMGVFMYGNTPEFLSPERARSLSEGVDLSEKELVAADAYAVSVSALHILTGKLLKAYPAESSTDGSAAGAIARCRSNAAEIEKSIKESFDSMEELSEEEKPRYSRIFVSALHPDSGKRLNCKGLASSLFSLATDEQKSELEARGLSKEIFQMWQRDVATDAAPGCGCVCM